MFHCFVQLFQCEYALLILPQFLSQIHYGKNCSISNGIGLKMSCCSTSSSSESQKPDRKCGNGSCEEKDCTTLRALGICIAKSKTESVTLPIQKIFFYLHSLRVGEILWDSTCEHFRPRRNSDTSK